MRPHCRRIPALACCLKVCLQARAGRIICACHACQWPVRPAARFSPSPATSPWLLTFRARGNLPLEPAIGSRALGTRAVARPPEVRFLVGQPQLSQILHRDEAADAKAAYAASSVQPHPHSLLSGPEALPTPETILLSRSSENGPGHRL